MDTTGFEDDRGEIDDDAADMIDDRMLAMGDDERRMHVRAYNHWVSLLAGRPFPAIDDIDPTRIADFGAHSVLIDFTGDIDDPRIAFLGRALREECGIDGSIERVADVPGRSLLSRLTDHYLQIIANRAPIGFEAEFVGTRGLTTLYRGILMPFSSGEDRIDYIYGVINWKEVADEAMQAGITAELDAAVRAAPAPAPDTPVWADGPSARFDAADNEAAALPIDAAADALASGSLGDRLSMARESAAQLRAADSRGRAALYRALGRAHDFALAADADALGYAALLSDAGLAVQARAPMTAVAKLVFGREYDKTRLTEYAAVLSHARRERLAPGALPGHVEAFAGGIKAIVAAERAARRPASRSPAAPVLDELPTLAHVPIEIGGTAGRIVVLVARVSRFGGLDVIGHNRDAALTERAIRALTAA